MAASKVAWHFSSIGLSPLDPPYRQKAMRVNTEFSTEKPSGWCSHQAFYPLLRMESVFQMYITFYIGHALQCFTM